MLRGTRLSWWALSMLLLAACSDPSVHSQVRTDAAVSTASQARTDHGRAVIESAEQSVETFDVAEASQRVTSIVRQVGGYIAASDVDPRHRAHYELKVPALRLHEVLDQFAALGTEVSREVKTEEVTAELIDLQARLAGRIALRDRLSVLLGQAETLDEVLRLEKEIARVQHQIEVLQGRIRFLESSVALADIKLDLGRPKVLGPLAWTAKAIGTGVKKAFVWKD